MRAFLGALILALFAAAPALAQMPTAYPGDGLIEATGGGSSFTGGAITNGVRVSGACATMAWGDVCCFDNNGVQCGYAVSDVAPQNTAILAQAASPLGSTNKTGAFLELGGGWETISSTAVQANCGSGDTFTLTWLGLNNVAQTKTCTRDATLNDSTHFTCGASNQAMAVNVAACLATASGINACGGTSCTAASVGFDGTSGIIYVFQDTTEPAVLTAKLASSGDHGVVTLGTMGNVLTPNKLYFATDASGTIAASTTYLSQCLANALCAGTPASGNETGSFLGQFYYTRSSGATTTIVQSSGISESSGSVITFNSAATLASGAADTGISRVSAGVVGIGTGAAANVAGTLSAATVTTGTSILCTNTATIGWSVVSGANTACTTTCTNACVFGQDTATGAIVACSDATADVCVCAGAS